MIFYYHNRITHRHVLYLRKIEHIILFTLVCFIGLNVDFTGVVYTRAKDEINVPIALSAFRDKGLHKENTLLFSMVYTRGTHFIFIRQSQNTGSPPWSVSDVPARYTGSDFVHLAYIVEGINMGELLLSYRKKMPTNKQKFSSDNMTHSLVMDTKSHRRHLGLLRQSVLFAETTYFLFLYLKWLTAMRIRFVSEPSETLWCHIII